MPDEVAMQHFGAFERGEPLLEHFHRGIGEARVDVARLLVAEARRRLRRGLEHEARGEIQRFGMLAELAALDAGAHRQRVQLIVRSWLMSEAAANAKKPGQLTAKPGFPRFSRIY